MEGSRSTARSGQFRICSRFFLARRVGATPVGADLARGIRQQEWSPVHVPLLWAAARGDESIPVLDWLRERAHLIDELAEIEIGRSRADGVCSVSSFSAFAWFLLSFSLSFFFFFFFFSFLLLLFILLFNFCSVSVLVPKNLSAGPPSMDHPSLDPPSAGPPKFSPFFPSPHDTPRAQTYTFQGPGLPKHHQNSTKEPREGGKNEHSGGRGKNKRETLGPPPFWAPPFGAPPFVVQKFNIRNWPKSKLAEVEIGRSRIGRTRKKVGRSRKWPKSNWPNSKKKSWPKSKLAEVDGARFNRSTISCNAFGWTRV